MSRRCCCEHPCLIESDDFNRADNTDLGAKWTEVTGDSEIDGLKLLVPAGGLVITTKQHPVNTPTCIAWVDVPGASSTPAAQAGEIYRIVVNYLDANTYVFGELEIIDQYSTYIRLYNRAGGSNTLLDEDTVSLAAGETYLRICRSLTGAYVQYGGNEEIVAWECIGGHNGGRKAGVANGGAGSIKFDNFVYEEHYHTNQDCPACLCECDGYCIPKALKATVFGTSGVCVCLEGVEIPLNLVNTPEFQWNGSADVCPFEPGYPVTWELELNCTGGNCPLLGGMFPLSDKTSGGLGPSHCNGYVNWDTYVTCPVSIQCDPLIITYGPFWCWVNEEEQTSCTYSIIITEA